MFTSKEDTWTNTQLSHSCLRRNSNAPACKQRVLLACVIGLFCFGDVKGSGDKTVNGFTALYYIKTMLYTFGLRFSTKDFGRKYWLSQCFMQFIFVHSYSCKRSKNVFYLSHQVTSCACNTHIPVFFVDIIREGGYYVSIISSLFYPLSL